jgi:hypothetical protein
VATWLPSRRALRIDPAQLLRSSYDSPQTARRIRRKRESDALATDSTQHANPAPASAEDLRPQLHLPFANTESQVRELLLTWFSGETLAPGDFAGAAVVAGVTQACVPFWRCSARVFCPWQAQSGIYDDSDTTADHPRKRRVFWESATGVVEHVFDDTLIPATTAIRSDLLTAIDDWPLDKLVRHEAERPSVTTLETDHATRASATSKARTQMAERIRKICRTEIPGETHRLLQISPEYSDETTTLVLLPVWTVSYTYRGKPFQAIANGCTGKIAGDSPASTWKVALSLLVVLAVVGGALAALWAAFTAGR